MQQSSAHIKIFFEIMKKGKKKKSPYCKSDFKRVCFRTEVKVTTKRGGAQVVGGLIENIEDFIPC